MMKTGHNLLKCTSIENPCKYFYFSVVAMILPTVIAIMIALMSAFFRKTETFQVWETATGMKWKRMIIFALGYILIPIIKFMMFLNNKLKDRRICGVNIPLSRLRLACANYEVTDEALEKWENNFSMMELLNLVESIFQLALSIIFINLHGEWNFKFFQTLKTDINDLNNDY